EDGVDRSLMNRSIELAGSLTGKTEESGRSSLPAAVGAQNTAAGNALDGDGAHHLDAPWIDDALRFYDLVSGAPHPDRELDFEDVRSHGVWLDPFAEQARAVAGGVVPLDGHARLRPTAGEVVAEDGGNVAGQYRRAVWIGEKRLAGKLGLGRTSGIGRCERDLMAAVVPVEQRLNEFVFGALIVIDLSLHSKRQRSEKAERISGGNAFLLQSHQRKGRDWSERDGGYVEPGGNSVGWRRGNRSDRKHRLPRDRWDRKQRRQRAVAGEKEVFRLNIANAK